MIEAKGPGYADALQKPFMVERLTDDWIEQATRQVQASEGRPLEWYFAEEKAVAEAERIFANDKILEDKIKIIYIPALVQ